LDPHFVTPPGFPETDSVSLDRVGGVPYHRLRPGPSLDHIEEKQQQFASHASDLVETLRPSVLHAHSDFLNCSVALGVGKRHSLPVVYEVRGFLEETWIANNPWASRDADRYVWRREAETRCMEGAAAVVTLGDVMRREILSRGIPPEKITVIPNAVDPSRFKPGQRDSSRLAELGISVDETVIGYVSSLRRNEGVDYLLKALRVLLDEGHGVRGLIVGSGPELPFLRQVAADLGIGDHVVFTGSVPNALIGSYYGLIDIFVVPRTRERVNQLVTPLKPYEAMAAGTLVVVSSIPALREVVTDGETGLTFTPEDSEDLARVLQSVLVDRDSRNQLARRGRAWVVEHRSWRASGEAYRALYERIA
jgi:glycosyltransferase involved in cell wall biosynthesis